MTKFAILVPAFQPNSSFVDLIDNLRIQLPGTRIVVVNDGSTSNLDLFFKIERQQNGAILTHDVNRGKGAAIKTGLNFLLNEMPQLEYVFTIDCDGQHTVDDLRKLVQISNQHQTDLILGARKFSAQKVPLRSLLGNQISRVLIFLFTGKYLFDTQCGLRGYGCRTFAILRKSKCNRFNFESDVLISILQSNLKVAEVAISTIYIEKNESSHFNPVRDSYEIISTFFSKLFNRGI